MYCVKCGNKIGEDDVFCPYCGAKQTSNPMRTVVAPQASQPVSQPVAPPAPAAEPVRSYEPLQPPVQSGHATAGGYEAAARAAKPKGRKLWLLAVPVALIALAVFFLTRPTYIISHETWFFTQDGTTEKFFSRDYNEDNLIISQTEYENIGLGELTYYYEYDGQGRMTAKYWGGKTDPGCIDYFEYDDDGYLIRMVEKTPGQDDDYVEERIDLSKQGGGYVATLRETDDDDPLTNEYTFNNNILVREHYYNDVCDISIISDDRNVMVSKTARYSDNRSAYSFDEQYDENHVLKSWTITRGDNVYNRTFEFEPVEKDSHGNVTAVEARGMEPDGQTENDAFVVRVVYEYRSETRFSKLFGKK